MVAAWAFLWLWCTGFSLQRLLLLRSTDSGVLRPQWLQLLALEHRLSRCRASQAQLFHSTWDPPGSGIKPTSPALAAHSLPLSHQGISTLGNSYSTPETVYENYRNNLRLRVIFFFFLRMIFYSSRMDLLLLLADNSIGWLNPIWDSAASELGFFFWQPGVFPSCSFLADTELQFLSRPHLKTAGSFAQFKVLSPSPVCLEAPNSSFGLPVPVELPQALLSFPDSQPPFCLLSILSFLLPVDLGDALG